MNPAILVGQVAPLPSVLASSGIDDFVRSFLNALQQPLTILVFIVLVVILVSALRTIRRLKGSTESMTEEIQRVRRAGLPFGAIAAAVPENLRPMAADLIVRWGFNSETPPTYRFSPAADVITSDRILASERGWRLVEIAPGLATSIGILGTFLGISLGLGKIDFESGTDPEAVFSSVGGVVDGLATAFWTSIFGVGVAIWVNRSARRTEAEIDGAVHDACEVLDGWVPQLTPLDNHRIIAQELAPLRELLETHIDYFSSQDVWLKRNTVLARKRHELELDMLEEVRGSHDTIRSLSDDLVTKLEVGFARAVDPHMTRMAVAIETVASAGVDSAKVFVDDMVTELQTGLADIIGRVGSSMEEFHGRFEKLADRLDQSARNQLDVLEKGELVAERVRNRLEELDGAMTKATDFQKTILAVEKRQVALQEKMSSSTGALMTDMAEAQNVLGAQITGAKEAIAGIGRELQDARGLVEELRIGFGNAAGRMKEASEALSGRVEAELALVERYAETAATLDKAIDGSKSFFKSAPDLARSLGDVAKQQQALAKSLAGTPAEVEKLVTVLGERFGGVDKAAASMRSVVASTEEWAGVTNNAISTFQEGVQSVLSGVLSQFDGELQRAVKALGAAMGELEDLLEVAMKQASEGKR